MPEYHCHVIFKVEAGDEQIAVEIANDVLGCIPEHIVDELADEPYVLKVD